MRARSIGLVVLAAALVSGCASPNNDDDPPSGFGVEREADLKDVLLDYRMSRADAECVAQHAFAANPAKETLVAADGTESESSFYRITQDMLAAAGHVCGVDWSDYDFTGD